MAVKPTDAAGVQRLLASHPPRTTFCFSPGLYRFGAPIVPKNDQRLIADGPNTILDGSKVVTGFVRSGSDFVAKGFLHGARLSSRNCIAPNSGCDTPQDVFLDGKPLRRVTAIGALHKGTFYEDFAANRLWLRDDPRGRLVEQAYAPALVAASSGGVTVDGFVVEEAATAAQLGAIEALNYAGKGWDIERNSVIHNHAAGIFVGPRDDGQGGSLVAHNVITGNGQEGIAGYGSGHRVADNEIDYNNRVGYSCYWECGGAKFAGGPGLETQHLTVSGNNIHDNAGDGFWVDINSYDVTF
ncbi:MAG: right-handed parallel beta-helix repeat-containing protein, partial [Candidatus Eremiobacteraeota bacterium]|nr:right-handed parallel beta-helix repeat-containing protein [Candidatus Eremiobacteraeota bacterium]